ncbi:Crp/Fnr family transcriptional regulator [Anaerosacchariphilus polymeriproducens]|uniref:Crp/Fnr family transcriptional regulator n=1 Tax=Anaerosacchariphilus polymeriproducens TaxID=1812858 RepID=A0A371AVW5_9FIRM|nr:Crp/Fnr family transcriptional regulator [Anaerosacchariphilus polymeriproducens]RDU23716.1 Crp/Fnr family transcriptional regulator [Anaerosacchariphilus polymeriproducens]
MLEYLYKKLPILKELDRIKRAEVEEYFINSPKWLLDSIKTVNVDKNIVFVRENDPANTIYIVVKGVIRAVDYRMYGIVFDFMRVDKLQAMGSMEIILDMDVYRASLQTVTKCTMLKMSREVFEKWLQEDIEALKREAKTMINFLMETDRNNRAYIFLQGANRLSLYFVDLYKKYAVKDILTVETSRQEMSEMTGLCEKTITRAMKKLQANGFISKDGYSIQMDKTQYEKLSTEVSKVIERR